MAKLQEWRDGYWEKAEFFGKNLRKGELRLLGNLRKGVSRENYKGVATIRKGETDK